MVTGMMMRMRAVRSVRHVPVVMVVVRREPVQRVPQQRDAAIDRQERARQ